MRVNDAGMVASYAKAFGTNGTAEEVMVDFGVNTVAPAADGEPATVDSQVNSRIILRYCSAKRLAVTMSELVRNHENQFGQLELNAANRSPRRRWSRA